MARKQNVKKEEKNTVQRIIVGITAGIIITLLGVGLAAIMIARGIVQESGTAYCAIAILLLSAVTASRIAALNYSGIKIWISLATGLTYSAILLAVTALFFDGQYRGIGVTIMVVLSGCTMAAIMKNKGNNMRKLRRNKNRPC